MDAPIHKYARHIQIIQAYRMYVAPGVRWQNKGADCEATAAFEVPPAPEDARTKAENKAHRTD